MKSLILLVLFCFTCATCTPKNEKVSVLKSDINNSIIDGFFDNDTTKVPENTYFIK